MANEDCSFHKLDYKKKNRQKSLILVGHQHDKKKYIIFWRQVGQTLFLWAGQGKELWEEERLKI